MWDDMFIAGVPLLERVLRAALVYLFALLALRLAGKREMGQFSTFDLVIVLFFSNILQNSMIGADDSITGGVVGAVTMLGLNRLVAWINYRSARAHTFLEGHATYLVKHGELVPENLDHELISVDELMVAAHKAQVLELEQIEDALLEPDGTITVISKEPGPGELIEDVNRRLDELKAALARIEVNLGSTGHASART